MKLTGKVALVTGASSGIGRAIAIELGRQGANVGVVYHTEKAEADAVAAEVRRGGSEAVSIQADVSKSGDVDRMVQETVAHFSKLDVLVNNAGVEEQAPFLKKPESEWDLVLSVDLKAAFLGSKAASKEMVRSGTRGTIINISSVHEDLPFPGYAAYCAAKGGLRMLCRDLAIELAPHGINVVNVAPGAIATPINKRTLEDPAKKEALIRQIPLGRIGTPEEVALLVAYLSSEDASYITGTTVFIDGGLMHNAVGL